MNKNLLDSVLQLNPAERMRLLDVIHDSLDQPVAAIDQAWYDEAQRRLTAYKSGKTQPIAAEDVLGDRP